VRQAHEPAAARLKILDTEIPVPLLAVLVSVTVSWIVTRFALEPWKAKLWLRQERWKLKAKVYSDLLAALAEQDSILERWESDEKKRRKMPLVEGFEELGANVPDVKLAAVRRRQPESDARMRELIGEITNLSAVAELWVSSDAVSALENLRWRSWGILEYGHDGLGETRGTLAMARRQVKVAAAQDLRLKA
jgi:hypothetical protein